MSSRVALEPTSISLSPPRPPPRPRTASARQYIPQGARSASLQARFPKPTLFIACSSSSSSLSSDSSSGDHSADEVPSCSSSTSLSVSQSAKNRRPLPVPPPSQPNSSIGIAFASSGSSPTVSPSSAASSSGFRRPPRALPAIPPILPPQLHLIVGPSIQPPARLKTTSSLTPSSSVTPANSQPLSVSLFKDLSKGRTGAALYTPARPATTGSNTVASSSKPPPPSTQTETFPPAHSYSPPPAPADARRPKLRVQTTVLSATTASTLPRPAAPAILVEPTPRPQAPARRSSLDSLTSRPTTLLSPDQFLFPIVLKKSRHRKRRKGSQLSTAYDPSPSTGSPLSKSPSRLSVDSIQSTKSRKIGGPIAGPVDLDEDLEELSPMEFKPGGHHDSGDEDEDQWGMLDKIVEDINTGKQKQTIVAHHSSLSGPALPSPTAEEIFNRRLNKLRRRLGETMMREFNVGVPGRSRTAPNPSIGSVGRVVASEGEEDDSSDDDSSSGYEIEDQMTFAKSEVIMEDDEDAVWNPVVKSAPSSSISATPKLALAKPVLSHEMTNMGTIARFNRRSRSRGLHSPLSSPKSAGISKLPSPYSYHLCACGRGSRCDGKCRSNSNGLHGIKRRQFSRRWFKEKGGKRWEEQDLEEVLYKLRML